MGRQLRQMDAETQKRLGIVQEGTSTEDDVSMDLQAVMDVLDQDEAESSSENGSMALSEGAARRFVLFDANGDGLFSQEEQQAIRDQIAKNNQTIGLKDACSGAIRLTDETGARLDSLSNTDSVEAAGGTVTSGSLDGPDWMDPLLSITDGGIRCNAVPTQLLHYEGELGSFDYDPSQWAVGYKTVYDSIGGESVTAEIPVLRYIGSETDGDRIAIPEGVLSLDYTFEGTDVTSVPEIPDGVESMHATFRNCTSLTGLSNSESESQRNVLEAIGNALTGGAGDGVGFTWTGEKGAAQLPSSVKDLSYCFENCDKLTEAWKTVASDTQLQNMDGYARGCQNLTTILDVSEAKLLPVEAQTDAYDGINTKMIRSFGTTAVNQDDGNRVTQNASNGVLMINGESCGISLYANEDSIYATGKTETNPYTVDEKEKLEEVKALQAYRANDRMYLADPSAVANVSGGLATTGTYLDENGQVVHTTDPTKGDMVSSSDGGLLGGLFGGSALGGVLSGDTGELVQRLGFGFLEYKVLNAVVKNPLISLGLTAGGQILGVLPGTLSSFGSALTSIGGLFGPDSSIGGMFTTIGEKLSGFSLNGSSGISKEEASYANMLTDAGQAQDAQTSVMSEASLSKLTDNMAKRGAYTAEYGSFQQAAEVQEGYGVFHDVQMASEDAMSAFAVALAEKQQADGGTLSDTSKQELTEAAVQILTSWSAYGENAKDALRSAYGGNPDEYAKGEAGLGKMMRAAVPANLEIIRGLNERYPFLSQNDLDQLNSLSFYGLDGVTFQNYQPGVSYAPEEDPYVPLYDENGQPADGVFDPYTPEEYDIDEFLDKALSEHDREYRTENYISAFGDGSKAVDEAVKASGELRRPAGASVSSYDTALLTEDDSKEQEDDSYEF